MCLRYSLLQGILFIWFFTNGELFASAIHDKVYVDVKPGTYMSKNVIKIDSTDKRIKRDENDEILPSLILEFTPEFFSNPLLKDLYATLTGGIESNQIRALEDVSLNDKDFLSNLKPPKCEEFKIIKHNNYGAKKTFGKNAYGFHLTIRPEIPKHVWPVRIYNNTCLDKSADENWCNFPATPKKCEVFEASPTPATTCRLTYPVPTKLLHFCGKNLNDHYSSRMPCVKTSICKTGTPIYTQCKSVPPPTVKPTVCQTFTTAACRVTCKKVEPPCTVKPVCPLLQKCPAYKTGENDKIEIPKLHKIIHSDPDSYILLFKRSSSGLSPSIIRKKRRAPYRRKRFNKKNKQI